ncbi:hypothetical protein DO021_00680 [Desulfobacter hydrogenophilus]|uniref:Uncharacterized protein n=1 Tax=Desulfobacter hydrogenophilus TaxID=2291 RepID=A0A328FJJ8_9BACT|nr:hypothetical protein [Desulfobacter hydrogenophilus]NDY72754.1 hypothetical protein [Desulfobacter hydrogenophilus]QBH12986.1 hypothetical protein EYB58_08695 [Desulfobacter hydrogenophilus]RAM03970.1 hypothetical protein DO021_00680 [Desulfobacter hydrogenophilus]
MSESKIKPNDFSLDSLKGMQSVRATFTLPRHAINLISTVANQLGVKQKSIFDHLIENKDIIDQIADEAKAYEPEKKQRKQKTFVLSRNCLSTLDTFARKYKLSRDVLLELSIRQLDPVITQEKQRHENRKILLEQMRDFRKRGSNFLNRARGLAGRDDETVQKIESFFSQYDKTMDELEGIIEKGKSVEQFPSAGEQQMFA